MDLSLGHVAIDPISPCAPEARWLLRWYFSDVGTRYLGRSATESEVEAAMRDDPSDDLQGAGGTLLVAHREGEPLGCVGLRLLSDALGEVKRLFVVPSARGQGLARRLMREIEAVARGKGLSALRLDTRSDLVEARRLYDRLGFRETAPFNESRYADRWYRKDLI